MGQYQDYMFILIVACCFLVAATAGYLMYRSSLRRPVETHDRADRAPVFASNGDVPARDKRTAARR